MKIQKMTVVEWDFRLIKHSYGDIVYARFLNKYFKPKMIHLNGFRIISHPKCEYGERCVCLEFYESGFKNMIDSMAALTLIHYFGSEIIAHDNQKIYWGLKRGESVADAAIRIAKMLNDALQFTTKHNQWVALGMLSWYSVLQHTIIWNGTAWISEAEYLRKKHDLPRITDKRFFSGPLLLSVTTRKSNQ